MQLRICKCHNPHKGSVQYLFTKGNSWSGRRTEM